MKKYLAEITDYESLVDVYDELPLWSAPFGLKLLDFIKYRPGHAESLFYPPCIHGIVG
ncbi:MAG: hypothetical protein JXA72_04030 [Bacteroidales bacterium]|nr:hypothetical protein [Bacteroidales bacterium]